MIFPYQGLGRSFHCPSITINLLPLSLLISYFSPSPPFPSSLIRFLSASSWGVWVVFAGLGLSAAVK